MKNRIPQKSLTVTSLSVLMVFLSIQAIAAKNATMKIGAIIDMEDTTGKMMLSCIEMAISDFYQNYSSSSTRLSLHSADSKADVVGAAAAALELIKKEEVQAILGPRTSMQADFVIDIGQKSQVPIISYSVSSPSLTYTRSPYFFRATQSDSSQVNAIASIVQSFGWREAVPVYVESEFGQGIIPHLTDALQSVGTNVPYRCSITPGAAGDEIERELYKLMSMQTRVFVVHITSSLATRFFPKVKEVGMMSEGYVWIVTDGVMNFLNQLPPNVLDSMEGVLGVRPYVSSSEKLEDFRVRWKRKFQQDNPEELNIYGLWAYDATITLAMATEKSGIKRTLFTEKSTSLNYSTDLSNLKVSQNGPNIIQQLSNTKVKGLTGDFHFINGELPTSAFEIVNVIGEANRVIGYWTARDGLVRKLNSRSKNLGTIIWPGDSASVPKGWEIPTSGKKLRIGVPVKSGFTEFLKVEKDSANNTEVKGYCIDVFDAAVKALPFALTYEYVPFADAYGQSAGTYNDLVYQVYLKNFDGVVGDTTIRANRSSYVEFTLPYTESGVSMIVPIKDNNHKSAWIFLKPLTWDLWVATFCFFIFIGFVIWVLEHRVNEEFRGPPSRQASTTVWFSFSTMVFVQRERLVSNPARTLAIIWFFVVLILTQSYTASLTSLLTVQKLLPTVTDVNELLRNGEKVGYMDGSFVLGILEKLGFKKSNLKVYNSAQELHELFSKGTGNGGISAAFDEVPYLKVFLAQYCSKYAMVEPTFLTAGFGFVFPKGSPLVHEISRATLNVKEGDKMKEIEEAWFGKQNTCPDPSTSVTSNSLSLQSLWSLFLLAGVASLLALLVFFSMFLYEHKQVLTSLYHSDSSTWSKILVLFRIFDQKDLNSHTYRDSGQSVSSSFSPSP